MMEVRDTGRLKYTCYRDFLNKNLCYLWKNDMHSVYRDSKTEKIFFSYCNFHKKYWDFFKVKHMTLNESIVLNTWEHLSQLEMILLPKLIIESR